MQTPNELLPDGLQMDLLWTNASPSSAFEAQTISLDLGNYSFYILEFKYVYLSSNVSSTISVAKEFGKTYQGSYIIDGNVISRRYTLNSNNIVFQGGYYGSGANNDYIIPYKIYGVR